MERGRALHILRAAEVYVVTSVAVLLKVYETDNENSLRKTSGTYGGRAADSDFIPVIRPRVLSQHLGYFHLVLPQL